MSNPVVVEKKVVVPPFGVRGEDFVEIWHSPEAPNEGLLYAQDQIAYFRNGILATHDYEIDSVVERSARKGKYLRADPEITKPYVCQLCGLPWWSQEAFTRHTSYAHASGMTRK